jgi:predicted amidohydrolase YtcJ
MPKPNPLLATVLSAAIALLAHAQPQYYHNANIYTMDPENPRATGMLVGDGMIWAVGSEDEIKDQMREQGIRVFERVDMRGRTIIPGLIDAHGHMIGLGAIGLGVLDLRAARSYEDVINLVRDRASHVPAGTWIVGRGWDNESWADTRLPHHAELSEAVPDHPVWLSRVDGHAGLANAAAMKIAGVDLSTPSPAGGEILRDSQRQATGVFVDNAEGIIGAHIPDGLTGSAEACILKAQEMCLAAGLTGVHDAGVSPAEIEVYQRLEAEGRLQIRVYAMVHGADAPQFFTTRGPIDSFKLSVYSAKAYADGAMGSRGAWLLEPYADRSTDAEGNPYVGLAVTEPGVRSRQLAKHALEHEYQVCDPRHRRSGQSRGPRCVRSEPLETLGPAGSVSELGELGSLRYLAEPPLPHRARTVAQRRRTSLVSRQLGVIASMQPTHCTSDMRWVDDRVRVGDRHRLGVHLIERDGGRQRDERACRSAVSVKQSNIGVALASNWFIGGMPRICSIVRSRLVVLYCVLTTAPALRVGARHVAGGAVAADVIPAGLRVVFDAEDRHLWPERDWLSASTMRPKARSLSATHARAWGSRGSCRWCGRWAGR